MTRQTTILSLPSAAIANSRFGLTSNTQVFRSPLMGTTQTLERPGARWTAEYTLPPMKRTDIAAWQGFLAQLRGGAGRFYGYDPDAQSPQGSALMSDTSATNHITNGNATGANVGTEGSGGRLPTAWVFGNANGLTRQIVGSGEENGVNYVSIRFYGTPTAETCAVNFIKSKAIPATAGEDWTSSVSYKLGGGSLTNVRVYQRIEQVQTSGETANMVAVELFNMDSSQWRRSEHSKTLTETTPATGYVRNSVYLKMTVGKPVDLTIKLGNIQLEQNAEATIYIPTFGYKRGRSSGARVNGKLQSGSSLETWNWQPSIAQVLRAGDYIAFDADTGRALHMVVKDADSDENGCATLTIEPPLRFIPDDNAKLFIDAPACVMALAEDSIQWSTDAAGTYQLTFAAEERF